MEPEFWHERWRRGEIGWHRDEINVHLQEHWPRLGVTSDARVFVPLCGKTLDLLWLAGQGHRVLGVEISPLAVDAFFAENGLKPEVVDEPPFRRYRVDEIELLCGDFFDLTAAHLDGVEAVFDRASLIALPPHMRPGYAEHLKGLIRDETKILLVTLDYIQDEMPGPPFSVPEKEVRALLGGRFDIKLLAELDVWAENPRFQQRGLSRLTEHVYKLQPRA
ncbi:MAG: thiopurine S-methyltransferase [Pseudomonadota bacterium]|nr:thiopurine S-methyltransferase [Pseudomonadota bacterium]